MDLAAAVSRAGVAYPSAGAIRIHPDPAYVRTAPFPPGDAPNRFDDPEGEYAVRYLADSLRGCLVELLARFTPEPTTEAGLDEITGLDDPDLAGLPDPAPVDGITDWIGVQQVGTASLDDPSATLLDAYDPALIAALDTDPDVRSVLQDPAVRASLDQERPGNDPAHLSPDLIKASRADGGRRLTQAVGRVLFKGPARADGLAYGSRHDSTERCWALRDDVDLEWSVEPLSAADPGHRLAVRAAAEWLSVPLPPGW